MLKEPKIIQGGMGIGISSWRLAKAVSKLGQLGVVSGTALDSVLSRRLQDGDPGGHMQRALRHFPVPAIANRILKKYLPSVPRSSTTPYKKNPMLNATPSTNLQELLIVANFVEVFLAKEGHSGIVGINYLEKVQMANLPSLYGAMLANVDYVLMGAGIPREIPEVLDKLVQHQDVQIRLQVIGANQGDNFSLSFSPKKIITQALPILLRPKFIAIISSTLLALVLNKKTVGEVNGFVIEGPTAGGHNAPPRDATQFDKEGQPIYGPKDNVDLIKIKSLGKPFWLAGSYGSKSGLSEALSKGASGIQVGTPFALCQESDLKEEFKQLLLDKILHKKIEIFTDALASPTGFPFKVVKIEGTLSEEKIYQQRNRYCDLGYLRQVYKKNNGTLDYRCPGEPEQSYQNKQGKKEDTIGRMCLCNALLANIGKVQIQKNGSAEKALVTLGTSVQSVEQFIKPGMKSYSASDVIRILLG